MNPGTSAPGVPQMFSTTGDVGHEVGVIPPGPEKYGMGDDILEAALNSRGRKLVSLSGDHGPSQEELYRRDVMSEDSLKAGE